MTDTPAPTPTNLAYARARRQGRTLADIHLAREHVNNAIMATPTGPARDILTIVPTLLDAAAQAIVNSNDTLASALLDALNSLEPPIQPTPPTQAEQPAPVPTDTPTPYTDRVLFGEGPHQLIKGKRYRIRLLPATGNRFRTGVFKVMGYLGGSHTYVLDLRPLAGTQQVPAGSISHAEQVSDDTPLELPKLDRR